jgi:hypothetical protein
LKPCPIAPILFCRESGGGFKAAEKAGAASKVFTQKNGANNLTQGTVHASVFSRNDAAAIPRKLDASRKSEIGSPNKTGENHGTTTS